MHQYQNYSCLDKAEPIILTHAYPNHEFGQDNETVTFNNALAEVCDPTYTKMGFHSTQSLDH